MVLAKADITRVVGDILNGLVPAAQADKLFQCHLLGAEVGDEKLGGATGNPLACPSAQYGFLSGYARAAQHLCYRRKGNIGNIFVLRSGTYHDIGCCWRNQPVGMSATKWEDLIAERVVVVTQSRKRMRLMAAAVKRWCRCVFAASR